MAAAPVETEGPWVQSALICEQVIVPADGVSTIVRALDTLAVTLQQPPDVSPLPPPDRMPPVEYPLTLALVLRSTSSLQGELSISVATPDGGRYQMMSHAIVFGGTPPAYRVNVQAKIVFGLPGLYWFDVEFAGHLLTRAPLVVTYSPPRGSEQASP
jgi:hypothetical protein